MKRLYLTLIFAAAGAAILLSLGVWQIQRLEWKRGVLSRIETTIAGDPIPLPVTPDPEAQKYRPVDLRGSIGAGELHVLVSVKRVGAGYRIIAPFTTDEGRTILVDRGFVPVEDKNQTHRSGETHIIGNLHWPDDRNSSTPDNDVPGNIWFARDIDAMAQQLDTEPFLVIARSETPEAPGVTPLPVDISGIPNDHLQYAITWFSLAAIWLIMTAAYVLRLRKGKEGSKT
ncbi:SURF1 family protein [Primorskyibacter flagellatus]|uniref:SURF1 family protein n=1 Tax=Primorskyibacter flagellatus TaxID=1387277 RepID=UPI003A8E6E28